MIFIHLKVKGQPGALNMREMVRWKFRNCFQSQVSQRLKQANTCSQVWDEELARVSQRWADQCMPGHDQRRNVGSEIDADLSVC